MGVLTREDSTVRLIDVQVGLIFAAALIVSLVYYPSRIVVVAALSVVTAVGLTVSFKVPGVRIDRYSVAMSLLHSTGYVVFLLSAYRMQLEYSWLTLFVGGEMVCYEVLYWTSPSDGFRDTTRRMRSVLSGYFLLSLVYLHW